MTAEEIQEANELLIYCVICDVYIGDGPCLYCEDFAREQGELEPHDELPPCP